MGNGFQTLCTLKGIMGGLVCWLNLIRTCFNPHIDYCSLDIEGAEAAILKTVPWNQVNVTSFSVEINHAGKIFPESRVDIQDFMKRQGYKFHSTVVIDDIFYKKEINRF